MVFIVRYGNNDKRYNQMKIKIKIGLSYRVRGE